MMSNPRSITIQQSVEKEVQKGLIDLTGNIFTLGSSLVQVYKIQNKNVYLAQEFLTQPV